MSDDNTTVLTELTAKVVSAYVGNNSAAVSDLPGLIATVYDSLRKAGAPQVAAVQPPQAPAVPIRKSVQADSIVCLECGKSLKMLKRHIATDHGLSVEDYRTKWNLPTEYPMVAPNYAQQRSELAVKIGLGRGQRK